MNIHRMNIHTRQLHIYLFQFIPPTICQKMAENSVTADCTIFREYIPSRQIIQIRYIAVNKRTAINDHTSKTTQDILAHLVLI